MSLQRIELELLNLIQNTSFHKTELVMTCLNIAIIFIFVKNIFIYNVILNFNPKNISRGFKKVKNPKFGISMYALSSRIL